VLSDWLLHVAQKEWCEIDDFIIAWLTACRVHRVNIDHIDIAVSVAAARWASARGRAFKAELDRQHRGKGPIFDISDLRAVDESDAMRTWRQANPFGSPDSQHSKQQECA
jgi:hypothetical protein